MATGLEADRVEVLLLELLYKTDYGNDFDREVRAPRSPRLAARALRTIGENRRCLPACMCACTHVCALVCGCRYGGLLVCPLPAPSHRLAGCPRRA